MDFHWVAVTGLQSPTTSDDKCLRLFEEQIGLHNELVSLCDTFQNISLKLIWNISRTKAGLWKGIEQSFSVSLSCHLDRTTGNLNKPTASPHQRSNHFA
jgi:hypothetical protein